MPKLHWTAGIHHDGSSLYVSNPYPALDETVTLTLRVPLDAPVRAVFIRSEPDGEGHHTPMQIVRQDAVSAFWSGELKASQPRNHYRFRLLTSEGAYWLNALGVTRADGPDWYDFKLLADYAAPLWVNESVFYQIFPDRFYNGDPALTVQPGAWTKREFKVQVREWGTPPLPYKEGGNLDFYGGDLPGIVQKLDYLQALGVNALYLNPIFTSPSNHRYNIDDFFSVDPHLGGNEALVELRKALDERGMKVILDVTPNHVSSLNPWFLEAQQNPASPVADFFTFYERPDHYATWLGVKSLPKLNYESAKLREIMYEGENAILRYWLKEPFCMDGWRLDVSNMTARQGTTQLAHKVWRGIRRAVKSVNPQSYLMGENFFDASPYLQGDELDAVQNYQGFNIPMWRWLAGHDVGAAWGAKHTDTVLMSSEALAEHMTAYRAALPWVIALQQFNQLCSHDTPRILSIVHNDKTLAKLGAFLLMTYPGVPCLYYGDEIGMEGAHDPDNRRTMIWDEAEWDTDIRGCYQTLIRIRHASPALTQGGYQQLAAEGGLFAFQRQSPEQRLIVIASRDEHAGVDLYVRHAGIADGTALTDLLSRKSFTVSDGVVSLGALPRGAMFILEAQTQRN
jgi:alpha-glucosidase